MPGEKSGSSRKILLSDLVKKPPPITGEKEQASFIDAVYILTQMLDASPTGRALLRAAVEGGVSVGLDPLLEPSGSFFYPAQNHFDFGYQPDVLQKTQKGQGRYMASLIGGLRRAWHERHGQMRTLLRPEDFLQLFRFMAADIESVTHLVGWELRAASHPFLWRHLLSGPHEDISIVFEEAVMENPQAQFNGDALRKTFDQWFAESERQRLCDYAALEMVDMLLLRGEYTKKNTINVLNYKDIVAVGCLPEGHNYLSGHLLPMNPPESFDPQNRQYLYNIQRDMVILLTESV